MSGSPALPSTIRSGTAAERANRATYGTVEAESGHQSSATTTIRNPRLAALTRSTNSGGTVTADSVFSHSSRCAETPLEELLPGLSVLKQRLRVHRVVGRQLWEHGDEAEKADSRASRPRILTSTANSQLPTRTPNSQMSNSQKRVRRFWSWALEVGSSVIRSLYCTPNLKSRGSMIACGVCQAGAVRGRHAEDVVASSAGSPGRSSAECDCGPTLKIFDIRRSSWFARSP